LYWLSQEARNLRHFSVVKHLAGGDVAIDMNAPDRDAQLVPRPRVEGPLPEETDLGNLISNSDLAVGLNEVREH
jgi:hypothetical protein